MHYNSYKGNSGTWFSPGLQDYPTDPTFGAAKSQANGLIYFYSNNTIASVTDGTSNTLLIAESAYGKLAGQDAVFFGWWTSGDYGDTMFTTLYPINPQSKLGGNTNTTVISIDTFESAASSFHPGGINVGLADGSVRFIKDTINTMPFSQTTGVPIGLTATANGSCSNSAPLYSLLPGNQLGIWQALSTRAGGEVISSDSINRVSIYPTSDRLEHQKGRNRHVETISTDRARHGSWRLGFGRSSIAASLFVRRRQGSRRIRPWSTRAEAKRIHDKVLVLDSHVDIPADYGKGRYDPGIDGDTQVDLPKLEQGGVGSAVFTVFAKQGRRTPEGLAKARQEADRKLKAILDIPRRYPQRAALARTAERGRTDSSAREIRRHCRLPERVPRSARTSPYRLVLSIRGPDLWLCSRRQQRFRRLLAADRR